MLWSRSRPFFDPLEPEPLLFVAAPAQAPATIQNVINVEMRKHVFHMKKE